MTFFVTHVVYDVILALRNDFWFSFDHFILHARTLTLVVSFVPTSNTYMYEIFEFRLILVKATKLEEMMVLAFSRDLGGIESLLLRLRM